MFYDQLFPSTINILGTEWKITVAKYEDDPYFKKYDANGYCSAPEHLICICDESTWPANKDESILFIINSMKWRVKDFGKGMDSDNSVSSAVRAVIHGQLQVLSGQFWEESS